MKKAKSAIVFALFVALFVACKPQAEPHKPAGTPTSASRVAGRLQRNPRATSPHALAPRTAQAEGHVRRGASGASIPAGKPLQPTGTPSSQRSVSGGAPGRPPQLLPTSTQVLPPTVTMIPTRPPATQRPRAGTAPDFTLRLLDGGKVTLHDLQGKAVILNFWASWCPPCRAEMPALDAVYREHHDEGLVVLGVGESDSISSIQEFVTGHDLSFPIPLDMDGDLAGAYHLTGLPVTVFINRDGDIVHRVVGGPMSKSFLENKISELLR